MPKLKKPLVVALIYDGLCTFEFGIAAEIFGLERPEMGSNWYRFASEAIDEGPLRANVGFTIAADARAALIEEADMIIVPGWKGVDVAVPETLTRRLRQAHARGARLVSICSGAFVLAATGLLNGKCATTHWRYADALRRQFSQIRVDEASLYRGEDGIFTSAGSAAGIDLMIELVRRDFGVEAANSVARRMVMPAHRSGGQAQFLEHSVFTESNPKMSSILERVRQELEGDWSIQKLASEANMSARTFQRRFREATGSSPGDWLVSQRVEAAKHLLASTSQSMEQIAAGVGFGSSHTLRHHFRDRVKISPSDYRRNFGSDKREPAN